MLSHPAKHQPVSNS